MLWLLYKLKFFLGYIFFVNILESLSHSMRGKLLWFSINWLHDYSVNMCIQWQENLPGTKIFASRIRHIAPDCSQAPTPSPEIAPAPAKPIKCSEPMFDTNKLSNGFNRWIQLYIILIGHGIKSHFKPCLKPTKIQLNCLPPRKKSLIDPLSFFHDVKIPIPITARK